MDSSSRAAISSLDLPLGTKAKNRSFQLAKSSALPLNCGAVNPFSFSALFSSLSAETKDESWLCVPLSLWLSAIRFSSAIMSPLTPICCFTSNLPTSDVISGFSNCYSPPPKAHYVISSSSSTFIDSSKLHCSRRDKYNNKLPHIR